ncbi:MAG: type II secretion system F family protein [Candidatus Melainabacteria bacterium]|nr:type II secretion system F family protein [Candidatus Melainabacteria bacterium]
MPTYFLGILTFVVVIGAGLLLMQPVFTQYVDTYAVRVRPRKEKEDTGADQPKDSALLAFLRTVGELVLSVLPGLADKRTLQLLTEANYRTQAHLAIYIGIKSIVAGGTILLGLAGSGGQPIMLLLTPFSAFLGWIMPNFFLGGRVKKRQNQILRELPTIIDLLIVCAQAGLGLLMAVDKVSKEVIDTCPILCIEMQQLIQDVKIFAKSVPIAMREMGERCGVDELISMASALIAAEQKGADISYPLRQQAEALRERLKRKKEEEAAKVPVKMVPVIMLFVMPLILAPMLGPAVVTIINALGPIMGTK